MMAIANSLDSAIHNMELENDNEQEYSSSDSDDEKTLCL
jgi:hypothetical protein